MRSPLLVAGAAALAAACGTTTQFAPTSTPPHRLQRVPAHEVQVHVSEAPRAPYQVIGILQARQSSAYSLDRMPDVLLALRRRAGQIGCEGIIVHGPSNSTETDTLTYALADRGFVYTREGFWASCIVYTSVAKTDPAPDPAAEVHRTAFAPADPECDDWLTRLREAGPGQAQLDIAQQTPARCHATAAR